MERLPEYQGIDYMPHDVFFHTDNNCLNIIMTK